VRPKTTTNTYHNLITNILWLNNKLAMPLLIRPPILWWKIALLEGVASIEWWEWPYKRGTTVVRSLTYFITYCCIQRTLSWAWFELKLVVIATDCIGSCKSMTTPSYKRENFYINISRFVCIPIEDQVYFSWIRKNVFVDVKSHSKSHLMLNNIILQSFNKHISREIKKKIPLHDIIVPTSSKSNIPLSDNEKQVSL
jgi:hypothetical protein